MRRGIADISISFRCPPHVSFSASDIRRQPCAAVAETVVAESQSVVKLTGKAQCFA